jgi:hypothetical protein
VNVFLAPTIEAKAASVRVNGNFLKLLARNVDKTQRALWNQQEHGCPSHNGAHENDSSPFNYLTYRNLTKFIEKIFLYRQ